MKKILFVVLFVLLAKVLLAQNYTEPRIWSGSPNPFATVTKIPYFIPEEMYVEVVVFNKNKDVVKVLQSGKVKSGMHNIYMDASGMSAGTYIIKMTANDWTGEIYITKIDQWKSNY